MATMSSLLASNSYARTTLVVTGVEGELAENIRLLVTQPPERSNERAFKRYVDGLPEQAATAMSAYGYYSAQATVKTEEVAAPEPAKGAKKAVEKVGEKIQGDAAESGAFTRITIDVTPNKAVTIKTLKLDLTVPDEYNGDFTDVLADVREQLAPGEVFVSANYEGAKALLLSRAQNLGYFDFEYTSTEVRVSRRASSADITLQATTGERFTFGDILYRQRTFSESFMNRWAPFKSGDPYDSTLIGELNKNLQASGYFASVRVRPLVDPRYGETVPITVDLTQNDQNQVSIGIGFSTDTKLRTKLAWGRPLINSRGHTAEWGAELSKTEQSASFAYRIPRTREPIFNYWGVEFGLKNQQDDEFDSFLSTLNFQRVSRTPRLWDEAIFLRWERERSLPGGVELNSNLVLPGISYSRSRSKGAPFPTWGQSTNFQLMGGSKSVLSSIDFLKITGRFRYLREVSTKNTLIGTVQYGAIHANDFDGVPLSQRFFAGGDRTVRGFAFREISPRNPEGDAVGGRYLEVLSVEYNYRFRDRWSGAIFSDAGRAFNSFDDGYRVAAGFGVRWQSPVGPFRIDIAQPISDNEDGGIRVHLSLGPDL